MDWVIIARILSSSDASRRVKSTALLKAWALESSLLRAGSPPCVVSFQVRPLFGWAARGTRAIINEVFFGINAFSSLYTKF